MIKVKDPVSAQRLENQGRGGPRAEESMDDG